MSGTALRTSSALRRATAAVLVVVGLLAAVPVTAGATGSGHDGSASCVARVDRRIKDVDKLLGKVATAPDVTASHRATLTQALQAARDGLVALRAEILALTPTVAAYHEDQGPTTTLAPEVQAACSRVATEFRIYALRKPQVNLVVAADRVAAQRALFDILAGELEAAIAQSGGDPDVDEARRLLDDYRARIDEAWTAAGSVGDAVVGLGPADWNANRQVLDPYVEALREVKHDLKAAKKDARKIVALLGGASSEPPHTS
jgi:hypothetical protein